MAKKTKIITYDLADLGRKHTGTDRSDLDIQSMVNRINAPDTQELVASGDMYGYYGHELRARFGMNPPDVWVNPNTGENVRIEPAIRTIKLSANNQGIVTTQHEFLETDTGNYSAQLYSNNAGGFSSAIMRKRNNAGKFDVTGFYGYDYVRTPNYNTNRGNGMFDALFIEDEEGEFAFDSLTGLSAERMIIKSALETAILHQFDAVNAAVQSQVMVNHYQSEALTAQDALINREQKIEAIVSKRRQREADIVDSLICPSVPFDKAVAQWDSFNQMGTSDRDLITTEKAGKSKQAHARKQERVSIFNRR